jgi:hypothetical protein
MFGATGLLSSVDYRNAGEVYKTPAHGIVITTVNAVTDSDWELLDVNNKLIKSTYSPGVERTDGSASITFSSFNSTGNHSMDQQDSNGKFVFSPYATPCLDDNFYGTGGTRAFSGGNHTHTFTEQTFSSAANFPSYTRVALYKRKDGSNRIFELPIGTIVFAADLSSVEGVSATSSYSENYLCAINNPSIAGTYKSGSNKFTYNIISAISGEHAHNGNPGPGPTGQTSKYLVNTDADYSAKNNISHTHQGLVTLTVNRKTVSLRTYTVDNSGVYITRGMIFGFNTTNIPPDWYICDGSVVNGYTTPRIDNRYLIFGNAFLSSHDKILGDNNYINVTASLNNISWNHRHGQSGKYQSLTSRSGKFFHDDSYDITSHNHVFGGGDQSTYYENDRFELLYCIYLP